MTLRVTRQFGEVLGTGGGNARVARQYLEVLGASSGVFTESLTSNMSMTSDAHVPERTESVSSNMSLTQNVVGRINLHEYLTSAMSFTQGLSRTQEASLTSEMTLADESGEYLGVGESALLYSTMNMTQEVVTSGLLQIVESSMSLQQTVNVQAPIYQYMASPMHMLSELGIPISERNLDVETEITMISNAGRNFNVDVTTTVSMLQDMYRLSTPYSTLNIVQTVDYGKTKGLEVSEMDLEQSVLLNGTWTRAVTQTLGIGHALTYYVPDPCGTKAYTPYIGENTTGDNPTPPDTSLPFAPGLPDGERFQLLYPGLGEATDTVELRAPNLDNKERLSFTRINRETRGGRLIVFADPTWPQVNTLALSFSGLSKAEIDSLQTFMVAHLGEEIGLIDWEGHQWIGVITSPTERGVQDGKGCDGRWTIGLEFEGVLLEEAPSGSHMALTSSVVAVLN